MVLQEQATNERRPGPARIALLIFLILAAALRWGGDLWEVYPKPDETVYVQAAEHWSAGRSPYQEGGYFYTPVFAWAAAELTELATSLGYLRIQRALNLLGICVAAWLALRIARWRTAPAIVVGVLWVSAAPGVALSIEVGNAAGLPTALTLAGLWVWLRRPHLAGVSLGLGQGLKPIAPLAALCLLARKGSDRSSSLRAGAIAVGTTALLLLVGWRYLGDLLANAAGSANPYNFSLQRVLAGLGLRIAPVWITVTLAAVGLWWIARRRLSRAELLVVALTLNLLAAPILWAHSLMLFLPVQLLAASQLARSLRANGWRLDAARRRAALPHVLAGLALASTVFSGSLGASTTAAAWLQSLVLAVPYVSVLYLGVYAFQRLSDDRDWEAPGPSQAA